MTPPSGTRATESLSQVESRFRGAIAASLDAFFLCESIRGSADEIIDFRIVELNERGELLLGRDRADLVDRTVCEMLPSIRDERTARSARPGRGDRRVVRGRAAIRGRRGRRALDPTPGRARRRRHRDHLARHHQARQVDDALAQGETRFHQLVESASDAIYRIDTHGVFLYANPIASRLMGCEDRVGIIGRMYLEFVRRDYHEQGIALYKQQVVERIPVTYWEFPVVTVDGRELWIGQNVHIEQRNGAVTSLFAVARDITERKMAEIALRESEERYRFLTDHSTDMLCRQTSSGTILYASQVSVADARIRAAPISSACRYSSSVIPTISSRCARRRRGLPATRARRR